MESERNRCLEEGNRRCSEIGNLGDDCRQRFEEGNVRAFLLNEIKKRCAVAHSFEPRRDADSYEVTLAINRFASEDDIDELSKLLEDAERLLTLEDTIVVKGTVRKDRIDFLKALPAVQKFKVDNLPEESGSAAAVKRVASKLINLDDESIPEEVAYVVESEAADIATVSEEFGSLEEAEAAKSVGYRLRRLFGLMKEAEELEIERLDASRNNLAGALQNLKTAATHVDDPVAKAVLLEQIEVLSQQQDEISSLIEGKRKKANGFFGLLSGGVH